MNSELRELLTDLKAAARIGHVEALNTALDAVAQWEPVAANQNMEARFIEQDVLPLGAALDAPLVQDEWLGELAEATLAALRAMSAVALAHRYASGNQIVDNHLLTLSKDERDDVRQTLVIALQRSEGDTLSLARDWLEAASPRTRAVGLRLLSNVEAETALPLLDEAHQEEDPDVRRALVDTLLETASSGHGEEVMQLLAKWAEEELPNVWVITKTLSGSWVVAHIEEAEAILDKLTEDGSDAKRVESARKALARHNHS